MGNNIPKIEIVPINKILFHEREDPERVSRLKEKIKVDGHLKNPVVVCRVKKNASKYLLLDGIHRVSALKEMGIRYILVQIIDYWNDKVEVHTWYHLLNDAQIKILIKHIKSLENITIEKSSKKKAERFLKENKIICYILLKGNSVFMVKSKNGVDSNLKQKTSLLNNIVNSYFTSSEVYRVTANEIVFLLKQKKNAGILIMPQYSKEDIMNLALGSMRLPAGITRFIIPKRALGLDIDLSLLKVRINLKSKNKLLREIIKQRINTKKIRFYPESVFIFNE